MTGYSAKTSASDGKGMAIGGLVCGIVGVFIGSLILGPVALILGLVAHRKTASGLAKAAIILGVVDIIIAIIAISVLSSNGFMY